MFACVFVYAAVQNPKHKFCLRIWDEETQTDRKGRSILLANNAEHNCAAFLKPLPGAKWLWRNDRSGLQSSQFNIKSLILVQNSARHVFFFLKKSKISPGLYNREYPLP